MDWSPNSWRFKPVKQLPFYEDKIALASIERRLAAAPPLVCVSEIQKLKKYLENVAYGESFLFQGGDCAETFHENSADKLHSFFRIFLPIWAILSFGIKKPVIKVGRIAGQFSKPRSSVLETFDGVELPVYRGDMINGINFDYVSRTPDPLRQEVAYHYSAECLNFLKKFIHNDSLALGTILEWMQEFIFEKSKIKNYTDFSEKILKTIDLMESTKNFGKDLCLKKNGFYTSHEALLLGYEEALTRFDPDSERWYAASAHMLWIGHRTRQFDHAHVEYCRGILNPIGLKSGSDLQPDDLLRLLDVLDPFNEPGKITLITRFGCESIGRCLPSLIRAVQKEGRKVIWSCDPMHGNTIIESGWKTRSFECILDEVQKFFEIHESEGTFPGGIHIEMTGKNVTECLGGVGRITPATLQERYYTACDPRLNPEQSIELSFHVCDLFKNREEETFIKDFR